MRAFLCFINDSVWDAVEIEWTRLEAAKSIWDKVALMVANANSKALNDIVDIGSFWWFSGLICFYLCSFYNSWIFTLISFKALSTLV